MGGERRDKRRRREKGRTVRWERADGERGERREMRERGGGQRGEMDGVYLSPPPTESLLVQ